MESSEDEEAEKKPKRRSTRASVNQKRPKLDAVADQSPVSSRLPVVDGYPHLAAATQNSIVELWEQTPGFATGDLYFLGCGENDFDLWTAMEKKHQGHTYFVDRRMKEIEKTRARHKAKKMKDRCTFHEADITTIDFRTWLNKVVQRDGRKSTFVLRWTACHLDERQLRGLLGFLISRRGTGGLRILLCDSVCELDYQSQDKKSGLPMWNRREETWKKIFGGCTLNVELKHQASELGFAP